MTIAFSEILERYRNGDPRAQHEIMAFVYTDLRRLARRHLKHSRWIATLCTTSLVNESYLKLISGALRQIQTRSHVLDIASHAMRQIVCDYARKRLREMVFFDRDASIAAGDQVLSEDESYARQLTAIDDALKDLERIDPRRARVVECRFFAGLSEAETAQATGASLRTVQRDWNEARAWLTTHLAVA
jgi:RNA polymerase sigma factor (TIGR02999 family)